jgi:thermitase
VHRPELWNRKGSINGTLLVRLKPDVDLHHPELQAHLSAHSAVFGDPVGRIAHRVHLLPNKSEALAQTLVASGLVEYAEPDVEVYAASVPNDPLFATALGDQFASLNILNAWNVTTGISSVKVAVIDSGCDTSHEDLGNILSGWSIVNGNTTVTDSTGHGTACCGIIAASGNNSLGGIGAAYGCGVIPVQFTTGASGSEANMIAAIDWVLANTTARIINISYAGASGTAWSFDSSMLAAIAAAWAANVICFFASGDAGNNTTYAGSPYAMLVGGVLGTVGLTSGFANYGPGVNVYTNWTAVAPKATSVSGNETSYYTGPPFEGTSGGCPIAAGIAALVLSANPGLSAQGLSNIMLDPNNQNVIRGGFGFPAGALDASKCVRAAITLPPVVASRMPKGHLMIHGSY